MIGMDAATGRPLGDDQHLAQSIGDILSTPIGTRVGRRDYGSDIFELVDAPLNALTRLRAIAATAVAIARWEPRIRLTRVELSAATTLGQAFARLSGERTDGPATPLSVSVPLHNLRPYP